jgi:transcription-repair coupling factor (superfamily II helicase)
VVVTWWGGAGRIDILVGTHSLLSDEVAFQDLALVVIDEEHRFGVTQVGEAIHHQVEGRAGC